MNCTKHFDLSRSLTASYIARFMICWVCRLYFSGLVCSVLSQESGGLQTMQSHSASGTVLCVTRRALGFSVLRYWLFFRSVYRFLCQNTSVSRFWCSLRFADFPFVSIWFSVFAKNINGFSYLISDVVSVFPTWHIWVPVSLRSERQLRASTDLEYYSS